MKSIVTHSTVRRNVAATLLWLSLVALLPGDRIAMAQLVAPDVSRVGTLTHFAIRESSGLAASRRHPGVIWTHNDSGTPFLFAIREDGTWIRGFQVLGANLIDWE